MQHFWEILERRARIAQEQGLRLLHPAGPGERGGGHPLLALLLPSRSPFGREVCQVCLLQGWGHDQGGWQEDEVIFICFTFQFLVSGIGWLLWDIIDQEVFLENLFILRINYSLSDFELYNYTDDINYVIIICLTFYYI